MGLLRNRIVLCYSCHCEALRAHLQIRHSVSVQRNILHPQQLFTRVEGKDLVKFCCVHINSQFCSKWTRLLRYSSIFLLSLSLSLSPSLSLSLSLALSFLFNLGCGCLDSDYNFPLYAVSSSLSSLSPLAHAHTQSTIFISVCYDQFFLPSPMRTVAWFVLPVLPQ